MKIKIICRFILYIGTVFGADTSDSNALCGDQNFRISTKVSLPGEMSRERANLSRTSPSIASAEQDPFIRLAKTCRREDAHRSSMASVSPGTCMPIVWKSVW